VDSTGGIVIYDTGDGQARLDVHLDGETVWLTQAQMAELFGVGPQAITRHIGNIYDKGELTPEATCSKMEQVRTEGARQVRRTVSVYDLDMIVSVGYRVNSRKATRFRQWATGVLREYLVKGFAMDDGRLKDLGGGGYWRELLDRIRDIRSSEKVLYRQVIYASTAEIPFANECCCYDGAPRAGVGARAQRELQDGGLAVHHVGRAGEVEEPIPQV